MTDTRCPDCGAPRDSITASCDVCDYDPDRFVSEADTAWSDRSPATRLYEVPPAPPCPPADLLTVERAASPRWWGWLLTLAIGLSWLTRGCR